MLQDYKLGVRMLLKYPGLTIAGGLALAIAIGIGAGWYDLAGKLLWPTIPLPDGDRIVIIETHNALTNQPELRVTRDFLEWRSDVRSIDGLGAYRTELRNLIVGNTPPVLIRTAALTATAFRTARVTPLIGRGLLDADEKPGAPGVVVLGYDVWQRSFEGRNDVVGSTVKLGSTPVTVVGVMPKGFGYPVSYHAWTPLQLRASYGALEGDPIGIIGRLKPGITLEQANAELRVLGERAAAALPATHAHLRPLVARLGQGLGDSSGHRGTRADVPAVVAGAAPGMHDRRYPFLRSHGDPRGRNGDAFSARCEPRANHQSAVRRGPGARVHRGRGRSDRRRSHVALGNRIGGRGQGRRSVLDDARP